MTHVLFKFDAMFLEPKWFINIIEEPYFLVDEDETNSTDTLRRNYIKKQNFNGRMFTEKNNGYELVPVHLKHIPRQHTLLHSVIDIFKLTKYQLNHLDDDLHKEMNHPVIVYKLIIGDVDFGNFIYESRDTVNRVNAYLSRIYNHGKPIEELEIEEPIPKQKRETCCIL